jgi:hypothetical protein
MTVQLSRLRPLDPREVWVHEAHDFTPWLLANADALADVLGIDMELTAVEHPVGTFSLDLVGRDLTNSCVLMVENQLTATDHGHLGQLVTYAAGNEARTIVWMATPAPDSGARLTRSLRWPLFPPLASRRRLMTRYTRQPDSAFPVCSYLVAMGSVMPLPHRRSDSE